MPKKESLYSAMNHRIPLLNSAPIINPTLAPMSQLSTWTAHNTHAYTQL